MKKITNKLVGGMLLLSVSMSLTSCEDVLGHWEKPTPIPITPTVEEVIKYGFQLKSLAGVDLTGDATSLKMTKADGTLVAEAEVSAGKITIKNTDLTAASITAAADFWFEATVGTRKYVAKVNIDPAALSPETDKTLEMATLGDVILSDGKFYKAGTAGAVAMIAYLGSETYDASFKNGLAIALADEGSMNWSTAMSTCGAKTAITGAKWCLPSQEQWKQMFKANDVSETSYAGLNTTINNAGGTILQDGGGCWSSSEDNPGVSAHGVHFNVGYASWTSVNENLDGPVRACLAF